VCLCAFSFLHARVVWSLFFMCVFIVFVFVLALCGFLFVVCFSLSSLMLWMFLNISQCCLFVFFVIELVLCSLLLILFFDLDPSFLLWLLFFVLDVVIWFCSLVFIIVVVVLCFCFGFLNL